MKKKPRRIPESATQPYNDSPKHDHSQFIPQRSKIKTDLHIIERFTFTEKQSEFINLALDKNTKMIFVSGPAGSSKTYLSIYASLKLLNDRRVSDLIYVRSVVESSDKSMGYLPGEISTKLSPYTQPLVDKLEELLPKNEIELLKKEDRISGVPPNFLRGLHWNAKFILCDEAQNMTTKELTTLITRIGEYSKVVVIGDPEQSDINGKSGFSKMINIFNDEESRQNGIHVFNFTEVDIVRSSLVQFIVKKLRTPN